MISVETQLRTSGIASMNLLFEKQNEQSYVPTQSTVCSGSAMWYWLQGAASGPTVEELASD